MVFNLQVSEPLYVPKDMSQTGALPAPDFMQYLNFAVMICTFTSAESPLLATTFIWAKVFIIFIVLHRIGWEYFEKSRKHYLHLA